MQNLISYIETQNMDLFISLN